MFPDILLFLPLLLFTTHSSKPSIKPHTCHIHCCPRTHLTAHTARITTNPFLIVPTQHQDTGLMGLIAPTVIARITGCIEIEDDLWVKRRKQRKKTRTQREKRGMVRGKKEWWKWEMWGPDRQEAPAEGTRESASRCSHTALPSCQQPRCTIQTSASFHCDIFCLFVSFVWAQSKCCRMKWKRLRGAWGVKKLSLQSHTKEKYLSGRTLVFQECASLELWLKHILSTCSWYWSNVALEMGAVSSPGLLFLTDFCLSEDKVFHLRMSSIYSQVCVEKGLWIFRKSYFTKCTHF